MAERENHAVPEIRSCGILPSPEKLRTSSTSTGEDLDVISTRGDFNEVWKWLGREFYTTEWYKLFKLPDNVDEQLDKAGFQMIIHLALGSAFDGIRHTNSGTNPPEKERIVLLYYTGHGLPEQRATELNDEKLTNENLFPRPDKVNFLKPKSYYAAAEGFLPPNRTLKGGELCLHHVGFCNMHGLLRPWIAALKERSNEETKKNKHLIVIADSCYSGKLVEDLQQLARQSGPWNENDCTVTVQSASGSGEETYGGYFTPCFVYFNQRENKDFLQELKKEWKKKTPEEKNVFREIDLPSPHVYTTMPSEKWSSRKDDPTLVLPVIQDIQLTLFRDAGFFKFCFLKGGYTARALTDDTAGEFLSHANFVIMDYRLMMKNDTPMALVLVEDPSNKDHVFCVHIHFFKPANTDLCNVSGVNLIHHNRPRNFGELLFEVDSYNWDSNDASKFNGLVEQCKEYVQEKEPGRWTNSTRWNMEKSFNALSRLKQRSAWMDDYVKKMISKSS